MTCEPARRGSHHTSSALTAVFAYHLVNFWMILIGDGIAMVILTRAREHRIRRYLRPGEAGAIAMLVDGITSIWS
jgi:hypothetical protein